MPHKLEIDILNSVSDAISNKKPFDRDFITKTLNTMLSQEIYLTIRGFYGDTISDIIFKSCGFPLLEEHFEKHNETIDEIKQKRLLVFYNSIKENNINALERLRDQLTEIRAKFPQDLTFLLTEAIKFNATIDIIRYLITSGADYNGIGCSGRRPLHIAVQRGNENIIAILAEFNADFNLGDAAHKYVLHTALYHNQLQLLQKLITTYQCAINVVDYNGNLPLHEAVAGGDRQKAALLLKLGADPRLKNIYGETALDFATSGTKGFDILNSSFFPTYSKLQIQSNRQLIAEDLRLAILEKDRITRIIKAIESPAEGCIHLPSHDITDTDIDLLITQIRRLSFIHGVNLSNNKLTETGCDKLVKYLQEETYVINLNLNGCKINKEKILCYDMLLCPDSRLKKLLESYDDTQDISLVVDKLIGTKASFGNIHCENWYLWHFACFNGQKDVVEMLIESKIDISSPIRGYNEGRNCLHLAVHGNHTNILEILLEKVSFDIDKESHLGKTPLHISINEGYIGCTELLLKYGANANNSFKRQLLLDIAIADNNDFAVAALLKHGAQLSDNAKDILLNLTGENQKIYNILNEYREKELQLCRAVQGNDLAQVELLVKDGVNIACVDEERFSPIEHAINQKHWNLAAFLIYTDATLLSTCRTLTQEEEINLQMSFFSYQKRDSEATTYFLRSRTKFCANQGGNNHNILNIYQDLYGKEGDIFCQYTRPLLQVVEDLPNLSIVYDPVAQDIKRADIFSNEGVKGNFSYNTYALCSMEVVPDGKNLPKYSACYVISNDNFYFINRIIFPVKIETLSLNEIDMADFFNKLGITNISNGIDISALSAQQLRIIKQFANHIPEEKHTIRISGRPYENYEVIRGTVIHEICHAVCFSLWQNNCDPFFPGSPEENCFKNICKTIHKEYKDKKQRVNLDSFIKSVFENNNYTKEKYMRELIVRVPQIIATYGIEKTEELCNKSAGFQQLFNYFCDKVLPAARYYIKTKESEIKHNEASVASLPTLQEICSQMVKDTPLTDASIELQARVALTLQNFYRMSLLRRTYHNLIGAQKCVKILAVTLEQFGVNEGANELRGKVTQEISYIAHHERTIFAFRESKRLLNTFKEQHELTADIMTQFNK